MEQQYLNCSTDLYSPGDRGEGSVSKVLCTLEDQVQSPDP